MTTHGRLRLAVFDCDGTLVDGQYAIIAAMTAAFDQHGLVQPDPAAVRRVVGLSLEAAIAQLLPEADAALCRDLAAAYRETFHALRQRPDYVEPLFPGVEAALDSLAAAGVVLGIATGKSRRGLEATLERHGLAGRFTTLQTSDEGPGKPSPDMLLRAMAETGASAAATVMIGDTVYDILMARSAGAVPIGVAWGYHEIDELREVGARAIVRAFAEIPRLVEALTEADRQGRAP